MSAVSKLSKEVQQELAREAIQAANNLGYCDEATNVLEEMGFELDDQKYIVTLVAEIRVPFGTDIEDASWYASASINYSDYESWDTNVVSIEKS